MSSVPKNKNTCFQNNTVKSVTCGLHPPNAVSHENPDTDMINNTVFHEVVHEKKALCFHF